MHDVKSNDYSIEALTIITSDDDVKKDLKTEMKKFLDHDLYRHQQAGLAKMLRKLLELWGLIARD